MSSFRCFAKIFWGLVWSLLRFTTLYRANWFDPVFMDLSILLLLPLLVESMSPEQTQIWVGLVVTPTVQIFKCVWVWFSFLCFELWRICFFVCFAAPSKFTVIFWLVTIAFDALRSLDSARKHWMTPFPTVFTLKYTQIHISTLNSSNILANIEASVNKSFSFTTALNIPNIYPDNGHVWLRRDLDDS